MTVFVFVVVAGTARQPREPLNNSLRALLALKRVAARRVTQEMAVVLFK
jgi:hypothetical protein